MGYHLDLSIPPESANLFVPPVGREELFQRAVSALQLGNQRNERLAMMIATANHTVVDEVAVVAASLHYGRMFRPKWAGIELPWRRYVPDAVRSDFLATAYLYRAALRQGRNMERCFDSEGIWKIRAVVRKLLGYEPDLLLEELNVEHFHQAIFSGIVDLLFGQDGPNMVKWVDFSGRYFLRDRVSVVVPNNEILVGLIAHVTTKDDKRFHYLGPVFPISVEEIVRWGKGFYRLEKSTTYEPKSDTFKTVSRLSRAESLHPNGMVLQVEDPATVQECQTSMVELLMTESEAMGRAPNQYRSSNPSLKELAPMLYRNLGLFKRLKGLVPKAEEQLRAHYRQVVAGATSLSALSSASLEWQWGMEQLLELERQRPSTLSLGESKLSLSWKDGIPYCVIDGERLQRLPDGDILAAGKAVYFTVFGVKELPLPVPGTAAELRAELRFRREVSVQYLTPPERATPFEDKPHPAVTERRRPNGTSVYWALVHESGASYRWVPYATRSYAFRVHALASERFKTQQKRRQNFAARP